MGVGVKRIAWRIGLFALTGLLMELFFTAASPAWLGRWNIHGGVSPWLMLDYGLLGVLLIPTRNRLVRAGLPLILRAVVYMAGIFAVELGSGWMFAQVGLSFWDYSHLPYNLHGYTTLTFAPIWYAVGLSLEFLHQRVDAMALLLARDLTVDDLAER